MIKKIKKLYIFEEDYNDSYGIYVLNVDGSLEELVDGRWQPAAEIPGYAQEVKLTEEYLQVGEGYVLSPFCRGETHCGWVIDYCYIDEDYDEWQRTTCSVVEIVE